MLVARLVPEAVLLTQMSYSEACELAYFGAKVIHPQTMAPAISRGIPIFIRNTFAPEKPGTRISRESDPAQPVKGVTTISGLALLNIEGAGMIGVPGTAATNVIQVSATTITATTPAHAAGPDVDAAAVAARRSSTVR